MAAGETVFVISPLPPTSRREGHRDVHNAGTRRGRLRRKLALHPDDVAAGDRRHRPADDPHALVWGIVDVMMQESVCDRDLALGIPDGEIGVSADGDRSFARIEPIHFRGVGRGQGDEVANIDAAFADAGREQQRQACFEARDPLGMQEKRVRAPATFLPRGSS